MDEQVVQINSLTKIYPRGIRRQSKVAVNNLSLSIKRGTVLGLIGPNGAGKSTTIYSMLGFLKPSTGSISLFGSTPNDPSIQPKIGFVSEQFATFPSDTAREVLRYCGSLSGIVPSQLENRIVEVIDSVGMNEAIDERVKTFSKGMLQRLGLAQAILHKPELLILDEPSTGLDPSGRKLFGEIINEQRRHGTTILFSTHILSDVEDLCDQVAMICNGELAYTADLRGATDESKAWEIEIANCDATNIQELAAKKLITSYVLNKNNNYTVACGTEQKKSLITAAGALSIEIVSVMLKQTRLEDIYMQITEKRTQ